MTGLKGRWAKVGLIILEIAGVLVAIAAGAAAFVYWRLQSGPVSLALLNASAEFAMERAMPAGHDVSIGESVLSRDAASGELMLSLENVVIENAAGERLADLPRVDAAFSFRDLAHGALGPRRLTVVDPVLRVVRRADRRLAVDAAAPGSKTNIIRLLTGGKVYRKPFQSAELRGATIVFHDEASGRSWRSEGATASILRSKEGYVARVAGLFDIEGHAASLRLNATYREAPDLIDATLEVEDAPVGDILDTFFGDQAPALAAPLTGTASIAVSGDGVVKSSRIDLQAGAGSLKIGAWEAPVAMIAVKSDFDPAANAFAIERLVFDIDGSRGEIAGRIALKRGADARTPEAVGFSLTARELVIAAKGLFDAPLLLEKAALAGDYEVAARRLTIAEAKAEALGVTMKASGFFNRPGPGAPAAVAVKAAIDGALVPVTILAGWPKGRAVNVREFIATRLPQARVENLAFALDLPAGAPKTGPLPEEAMTLTFDVSGGTAIYSPGMTPLSEASGTARLTGNRFVISGIRGKVGRIAVSDGEVDFTELAPKGAPVTYAFVADGAARDILGVLNQEPLALLKETKLLPEQFTGSGHARVKITRPNLKEAARTDYEYDGEATFSDLTISDFYRNIDLTKATGSIALGSRSMRLVANAKLGGAPIELTWLQRFYAVDGPSRFDVEGTVDSATGDVFGVPTRQLLRGPVSFKAKAAGKLDALDDLTLEADFRDAAMTLDALGWRKEQGVPAAGAIDVKFADAGATLRKIDFKGAGIDVSGSGRLGKEGAIETATFERFRLDGAADLSIAASRNEAGALDAALTGRFLNAGPLVEQALQGRPKDPAKPSPWKTGLIIRGRIDELALRGAARYRDASLDFARSAERIEALEFSARTEAGSPVSVVLKQTGGEADARQILEARSDDIGALLAGVFAVTSVRGGEGSMEIVIRPEAEGAAAGIDGVIEARGMRLVEAPLLARVFAAASFDGLLDLLNGDGIDLAAARAEFGLADGVLSVRDARANGPSVGLTAAGEIATGAGGKVALGGAVAPAYQFNSFLGKTPVVGDLFVNRKGEGLVALSYDVKGPSDAPMVTVNPLSALTPGLLRRMFEGRDEVETAPAPKPAPAAPSPAPPPLEKGG